MTKTPTITRAQRDALLAVLSDESKWCQQAEARTGCGMDCFADRTDAASWCLEGAITRSAGSVHAEDEGGGVFDAILEACGDLDPYEWNDLPGRTYAEVVALIKGVEVSDA